MSHPAARPPTQRHDRGSHRCRWDSQLSKGSLIQYLVHLRNMFEKLFFTQLVLCVIEAPHL